MDVEVISDEMDREPLFEIENKQEGFRYRLLNNNPRNIARKKRKGFEIVTSEMPERLVMSDATPIKKGEEVDGTQTFDDVILARIPLSLAERNDRKIALQQERRSLKNVAEQFRNATKGAGYDARGGDGNTRYGKAMTESRAKELIASGKMDAVPDLPDGKG